MCPFTRVDSSPYSLHPAALRLVLAAALALTSAASVHALGVPQQLAPSDGQSLSSRDITFTWGSVPAAGGAKYGIQVQYLDLDTGNWINYKTEDNIIWYGGWYTIANFNKDYGRWRVRAMTSSSNSPYSGWRLFAFDQGAPGTAGKAVLERSKAVSLPANGDVVSTLACPDGTIVSGGGFRSGSAADVHTYSNVQYNNGWSVGFENLTNSSKSVDVYVECLRGVSGYAFSALKLEQVQPGHLGVPMAACSKGVMSGGGFRATSRDLKLFSSFPDLGGAKKWIVYAHNGGSASQQLGSEAVCMVGTGAKVSLATSAATFVGLATTGTVTVSCPTNRLPLSGGFSMSAHEMRPLSSRGSGNGWKVVAYNSDSQGWAVQAHAMCAKFN